MTDILFWKKTKEDDHESYTKEEIEAELGQGDPSSKYIYGDYWPVTTSVQYYFDYINSCIQAGRFPGKPLNDLNMCINI